MKNVIAILIGATLIALPLCRSAEATHRPVQNRLNVTDFARKIYMDGVPHDEASAFTSEDAEILLEMLWNYEDAQYWPNIESVPTLVEN